MKKAIHDVGAVAELMPAESPVARARLLAVLAAAYLEASLQAAAERLAAKAESREP